MRSSRGLAPAGMAGGSGEGHTGLHATPQLPAGVLPVPVPIHRRARRGPASLPRPQLESGSLRTEPRIRHLAGLLVLSTSEMEGQGAAPAFALARGVELLRHNQTVLEAPELGPPPTAAEEIPSGGTSVLTYTPTRAPVASQCSP